MHIEKAVFRATQILLLAYPENTRDVVVLRQLWEISAENLRQ